MLGQNSGWLGQFAWLLLIAAVILAAACVLWRQHGKKKRSRREAERLRAVVTARRTDFGVGAGAAWRSGHARPRYLVTFRTERGDMELPLDPEEYGRIVVGERGVLAVRDGEFAFFERGGETTLE